jgi:hypothetical protein
MSDFRSQYFICSFPKNNKFHVRKYIYDNNEIINIEEYKLCQNKLNILIKNIESFEYIYSKNLP